MLHLLWQPWPCYTLLTQRGCFCCCCCDGQQMINDENDNDNDDDEDDDDDAGRSTDAQRYQQQQHINRFISTPLSARGLYLYLLLVCACLAAIITRYVSISLSFYLATGDVAKILSLQCLEPLRNQRGSYFPSENRVSRVF